MKMRGHRLRGFGLGGTAVALALALVVPAIEAPQPAEAHLVGFSCTGTSRTPGVCGDDDYYCTLGGGGYTFCWYDGDGSGCFSGSRTGCSVGHSYTYQSAKNDLSSNEWVNVTICGDQMGCPTQSEINFVRICVHHHAGWVNDLDCEDQDGYARQAQVGMLNGVMHGSPWW
jgi:hypothetical protein